MRKILLFAMLAAAVAVSGVVVVQAAAPVRVEICHRPPDDPDNFHTLKLGARALQIHLDHGDLEGTCLSNCQELCGDANACTIDCDPFTGACLSDHPPVDCDDTNGCTTDSCDRDIVKSCVWRFHSGGYFPDAVLVHDVFDDVGDEICSIQRPPFLLS